MVLRVRIVAVFFLFCTISPLLASAYSNVQGQEPTRNEIVNAQPEDNSGQVPDNVGINADLPPRPVNNYFGNGLFNSFVNNAGILFGGRQEEQPVQQEEARPVGLNGGLFGGRQEEQPVQQEERRPAGLGGLFGGKQEEATPEGLKVNFYGESCPAAAGIIKKAFNEASAKDAGIGASLVRLFSHDCFVQGCDASVLLDRNPNGQPIEKTAAANGEFIRGTEVIDQIKADVEKACPGVVSCADILALSTRDALVASGLPNFEMPLGRRDSLNSNKDKAEHDLPIPTDNVNHMLELFRDKGLNEEDLATLIGAHSIGTAHCASFGYRTQNPEKNREMNPKIPPNINHMCWNNMATLPIDSSSHYKMDSLFYKGLLDRSGLLESDHSVAFDPRTSDYVQKYADDEQIWHEKFTASLIKMSRVGVLTGNAGQIRKQCRFVN